MSTKEGSALSRKGVHHHTQHKTSGTGGDSTELDKSLERSRNNVSYFCKSFALYVFVNKTTQPNVSTSHAVEFLFVGMLFWASTCS